MKANTFNEDGADRYCWACDKWHRGRVWYYRDLGKGQHRQWMCGLRFLLLHAENIGTAWILLP
jgi:hypothetical protein